MYLYISDTNELMFPWGVQASMAGVKATTTTTVDYYDGSPTVEFRTCLFVPISPISPESGLRDFDWRPAKFAHHRETIYTQGELVAKLAHFCPRVAVRVDHPTVAMFRVRAHCLTTHFLVGEWVWHRSEETGRFISSAEPMATWDDRLRVEAIEARLAERERAAS